MRKGLPSALLALVLLAGAASLLGACNTARGFGEDLSSAGHAISNGAERDQQK